MAWGFDDLIDYLSPAAEAGGGGGGADLASYAEPAATGVSGAANTAADLSGQWGNSAADIGGANPATFFDPSSVGAAPNLANSGYNPGGGNQSVNLGGSPEGSPEAAQNTPQSLAQDQGQPQNPAAKNPMTESGRASSWWDKTAKNAVQQPLDAAQKNPWGALSTVAGIGAGLYGAAQAGAQPNPKMPNIPGNPAPAPGAQPALNTGTNASPLLRGGFNVASGGMSGLRRR